MEYVAISKNIRISPRKVRLVADAVKNLKVDSAMSALATLNKRAAMPVRKTLESAIANAVNNFKAERDSLLIKEIMVGEGSALKRYHYAARGRVRPYKRRSSHIRIVLGSNLVDSSAPKELKEKIEKVVKKEAEPVSEVKNRKEKKS